MPRVRDVRERLESRHRKEDNGCWVWTSYTDGRYGLLSIKGKEEKAHRASYSLFKGKIPSGMSVCHSCDNTLCINPEHLFIGTHYDNMQDMAIKDRANNGREKLTLSERKNLVGSSIKEIMKHGYSQSHASRIRRGLFKNSGAKNSEREEGR